MRRSISIRGALRDAQKNGFKLLDLQLLLLSALGENINDRAWLLINDKVVLNDSQEEVWVKSLERLRNDEPVAYILGKKEFFGLPFHVNSHVLIPRPDTETLVNWALSLTYERDPSPQSAGCILDLGTGSGAVALSIKSVLKKWHLVATDINSDALATAALNARELDSQVSFYQGSWFAALPSNLTAFDLIVTNPPYIPENDPHLVDLTFEPQEALTSGNDGLRDIKEIVASAPSYLRPNGWLLIEHGHNQASIVQDLLHLSGFRNIESKRDLNQIQRCSGGQWGT